MVHIKTYMFNPFHEQYLVLLTMAPRNTYIRYICFEEIQAEEFYECTK